MATLQKKCISILTGSVTYHFHPSTYNNQQTPSDYIIATPWFSQGKFKEAGLFLRLIFEESNTCSRTVLQMCTTEQRTQLEDAEWEEATTLSKLDLSPSAVLVPGVELCRVACWWTCCKSTSELAAIKPTVLNLPLVVEIESKPPNTNTAFHSCKSHGADYECAFEAHFQNSAVLHPLAFLGRLHGGLLSDVTLRVGKKELRAHRNILAAVSEVFRTMFEGDRFQESSKDVVEVKDVRSEVLEAALRHAYGQELGELDANTVVELLILAERYQLLELKALCEDLLSRDTSLDALQLLAVADTHRAQSLKEAVIKRIVDCPDRTEILSRESVMEIVRSNTEAFVDLFMRME